MAEKKINPFTDELEDKPTTQTAMPTYFIDAAETQLAGPEFHQMTINQLLLITFACAASIALISQFHIGGTLTLFGVCAIVSGSVVMRIPNSTTASFVNEVLWGFIMPIACIVTDPMIFTEELYAFSWNFGALPPAVVFCYGLFFWQIINLGCSWFVAGTSSTVSGWFAGTFMFGTILAFGVGICLIPISIIGLIVILGVLGFTPLITGFAYLKACRRYWPGVSPAASNPQWMQWAFFAAGFLISILAPLCAMGLRLTFGDAASNTQTWW